MMRSLLFAASMLLASSVQVLAQEFETATSAVKNMRVGWNLGNTLDANSGSTTNMWIEKYTQGLQRYPCSRDLVSSHGC